MMYVAYARGRKAGSPIDEQLKMLKGFAGEASINFSKTYVDKMPSGRGNIKPEQLTERSAMLANLSKGDVIVVSDFATPALSEWDWMDMVAKIADAGVRLVIVSPKTEFFWGARDKEIVSELTSSAMQVFEALRKEQTDPARRARIKQGALGGRPVIVYDKYPKEAWDKAEELWATPGYTGKQIAEITGIPIATLNRYMPSMRETRKNSSSKNN